MKPQAARVLKQVYLSIPTINAGFNSVPNLGLNNSAFLGTNSLNSTVEKVLDGRPRRALLPAIAQPPMARAAASVSVPKPEVFPPSPEFSARAHVGSLDRYYAMYNRSIEDPEGFWREIAERDFHWFEVGKEVLSYNYKDDIKIRWFEDWKTNICYNCLDRHVDNGLGDRTAIIWEGNEPGDMKKISYGELLTEVSKFANVLKEKGVKKGDRVTLYMPMIPELTIAMLACARIGAIHSIVFGAFSPDALNDRIIDAQSSILVTANGYWRGAKYSGMKDSADKAMMLCEEAGSPIETCIVYQHTGEAVHMREGRDIWWGDAMKGVSAECPAEVMGAEDPLFILYTSGSTGKPKGVLHTTGGYMVYAGTTFENVFDYHPNDIYWCTADIGWITGHSYIVYGPLSKGATSLMFEGVPNYPKPDRFWDVVEKHKVNIFYTAPTAIRSLMGAGAEWPAKHDLSSLRVLGTVGEPINPAAWEWYHENIGNGKTPIVDTWWQTETGGILITPLPGATPTKPGSATLPFFGVKPAILDKEGNKLSSSKGVEGMLVIEMPWPGQARTVWGDPARFKDVYFSSFPGYYFTGDGARRDEDGYYWITGRVDDVINVSGHRLGTAEVESALVAHRAVTEAAVVGFPHDIKGQGIYAYVTLKGGEQPSDRLKKELKDEVRRIIGPIATPDRIHITPELPKTRSGKIVRRLLRKIAEGETDRNVFGDTSTLANPGVVDELIANKQ